MNLNQLRYFATVAQLNNLSKAAEILGVNQPALSKSISSLEDEVGTKLFDRSGKKIALNPQGERFLACVDAIYEDLLKASADIEKMQGTGKEYIRVCSVGCVSSVIECASIFKDTHKNCEFQFEFGMDNLENIDMKNYDIAIYPEESKFANLAGHKIATEKYFLAVAKGHPLADKAVMSPKYLENQDIIYVRSNGTPEYIYHICKALGVKFNTMTYTDTRQSQLMYISTGKAVGIIPEGLIDAVNKDKIVLIPFMNKNFTRNMMICFRKEKYLSKIAKEFKELIEKYFENLNSGISS